MLNISNTSRSQFELKILTKTISYIHTYLDIKFTQTFRSNQTSKRKF
jgi:hypothetical protein